MLTIPVVLRGFDASSFRRTDDEYGGLEAFPVSEENETGSQEGAEPFDLEADQPLRQPFLAIARINNNPTDVVGPDVEELLPEMPSEILDLMGLRGRFEEDAPVDDCAFPVNEDLIEEIIEAATA